MSSSKQQGRPRKYDRDADAAQMRPWLDKGLSYERAAQVLGWKKRRAQNAAEIARGLRDSSPDISGRKTSPEPSEQPKQMAEQAPKSGRNRSASATSRPLIDRSPRAS